MFHEDVFLSKMVPKLEVSLLKISTNKIDKEKKCPCIDQYQLSAVNKDLFNYIEIQPRYLNKCLPYD